MKTGSMEEKQFYLWSKLTREKNQECEEGRITLEELGGWLKNS